MPLFFTGCDLDEATDGITGFIFQKSGGDMIIEDRYGNTITVDAEQVEHFAALDADTAQAFLDARFKTKFPDSYSEGETVTVTDTKVTPQEARIAPQAQVIANLPAAVNPAGVGTPVSIALNGLLAIGLLAYRTFALNRINRKDAALEGAGRLVDTIYNVAETLPDKESGRKVALTLDKAIEQAGKVVDTAGEFKKAIDRTETPSIDTEIYQ